MSVFICAAQQNNFQGFTFNYEYMCVSMDVCTGVWRYPQWPESAVSFLELKSELVVSSLTWGLGTKPGSTAEAAASPRCWAASPASTKPFLSCKGDYYHGTHQHNLKISKHGTHSTKDTRTCNRSNPLKCSAANECERVEADRNKCGNLSPDKNVLQVHQGSVSASSCDVGELQSSHSNS